MAKAIIGITDWTQTRSELAALAHRVDAGERLPETDYRLNFASPVALLEALPTKRLEVLRTIREAGPVSIYALAKRLRRNYSNVYSDVMRLLDLGLAEKDEHGRICVPWDDVVVRVDSSLMAAA